MYTFEVTFGKKPVFVGASWLDCVAWVDRRPGYVIRPQKRQVFTIKPACPTGIPKPEEPTLIYPEEVIVAACRDYKSRTGREPSPKRVEAAKNSLRPSEDTLTLRELIAVHAECWKNGDLIPYTGEIALPRRNE